MADINPVLALQHSTAAEALPTRTIRHRRLPGRDALATAGLRCMSYAGCSELVASPHDVDPRPALRERRDQVDSQARAEAKADDGGEGLDDATACAIALGPLMAEVAGTDLARLKAEYSGLFEVGSQGPPAPIRFYDYFGYVLGEPFAWQPDHLSMQLEFMHYLCFREAEAGAGAEALSFQLAQLDFTERHLASWVPQLAANVGKVAAGSLYDRVVTGVLGFILADLAWQNETTAAADSLPPSA
ncbi:MAG: hypothetical protein DYH20_13650 [Gammaproteobacteria bacterium PRO9]|nr:hypothetical protein [Gammaproteobacteria bacterium PRO9]